MLESFTGLKKFLKGNRCGGESLIFYMNYRVTFLVLIFCCILISTQQFIGHRINCLSKSSTEANAEYLNDYCWAASTYSVKTAYFKEVGIRVPHPGVEGSEERSEYEYRNFYQYVHIVLFIQALLFYLPHFFWKNIEPDFLTSIPGEFNKITSDSKDEEEPSALRSLEKGTAVYVEDRLVCHRYLPIKYLMCEILATLNILVQVYALDVLFYGKFLGLGLWLQIYYNSEILSDPLRLFPLVTICTFRRYGPSGYIDVINALCVLPMNAINGKIFLCLWLWYTILFFLSVCHLIYFLACILIPVFRILPIKITSLFLKDYATNDSYAELVSQGDMGVWFILSSLKRSMDQCNFYRMIDNIEPVDVLQKVKDV